MLLLFSCHSNQNIHLSGETMGTTYSISIVPNSHTKIDNANLQGEIDSILIIINNRFSTYIDSSEISMFNKIISSDPMPVSAEFYDLIFKALEIYEYSGGSFDITVQPLVNIWGFGPDFNNSHIPDSSKIIALMEHIGSDKLTLTDMSIGKKDPLLKLDLSAIAKGWGVDRVAGYLKDIGFNQFMIEIGGDILVSGLNCKNLPWKIGIRKPDDLLPDIYSSIEIKDKAVATSGTYHNYFNWHGINYSHLIDPLTGYPIQHELVSATVVADDCATADAIATAVMIKGYKDGLTWIHTLPGVECLFISRISDGEYISALSEGFSY